MGITLKGNNHEHCANNKFKKINIPKVDYRKCHPVNKFLPNYLILGNIELPYSTSGCTSDRFATSLVSLEHVCRLRLQKEHMVFARWQITSMWVFQLRSVLCKLMPRYFLESTFSSVWSWIVFSDSKERLIFCDMHCLTFGWVEGHHPVVFPFFSVDHF